MVNNAGSFDHDADYAQYAPAEDDVLQSNLKIFYIDQDGFRRLVAARSAAAAAKLLDATPYILRRDGGESSLDVERAIALSDAGAVFQGAAGADPSTWRKVKSSVAAAKLPQHGGYRPGTGAKPIEGTKMKLHSFWCTDEQWSTILAFGGGKFLREAADKAKAQLATKKPDGTPQDAGEVRSKTGRKY